MVDFMISAFAGAVAAICGCAWRMSAAYGGFSNALLTILRGGGPGEEGKRSKSGGGPGEE